MIFDITASQVDTYKGIINVFGTKIPSDFKVSRIIMRRSSKQIHIQRSDDLSSAPGILNLLGKDIISVVVSREPKYVSCDTDYDYNYIVYRSGRDYLILVSISDDDFITTVTVSFDDIIVRDYDKNNESDMILC